MREKLIDLLNDGCNSCEKAGDKSITEFLADYLLANGVTVLPCKVGDTVYSIWEDDDGVLQISEDEVIDVSEKMIWVNGGGFSVDSIGKSDFFSREEAEKEIAERMSRNE